MKIQKERVIARSFVWLTIGALGWNLSSCTTLVTVPMDLQLYSEKVIHVEVASGKEIKIRDPRSEDGFLAGLTPKYQSLAGPYKRIRIPLTQVTSIRVERFSSKKTMITAAGVILVTGTGLNY